MLRKKKNRKIRRREIFMYMQQNLGDVLGRCSFIKHFIVTLLGVTLDFYVVFFRKYCFFLSMSEIGWFKGLSFPLKIF